jgi:endonuclease/exonuclease/phosphatase (EEP) superfamily protein YafD
MKQTKRLIWLCTAGTILAGLMPGLGRWGWSFDILASFRLQIALASVTWTICLLVMRRKLAILSGGFSMMFLAFAFQLWLQPGDKVDEDAPHFRVVGYNVWARNTDQNDVLDFLRETDPDVAVCCEVRGDVARRFSLELKDVFPYQALAPRESVEGIVVLSKHPILSQDVTELPGGSLVVNVDISYDDERIHVLGIHPFSPVTSRRWKIRNEQLETTAELARTMPGPAIVIGDFNTPPWSHYFGKFERESSFRDTQRGVGFTRTWPRGKSLLQIPIDHAFVSEHWLVKSRTAGRATSSDHLPLVVDLVRK